MSEIFLAMFSSRTFMVSLLIFKSFIHLEFICVYGVSLWSTFTVLHVAVQLYQHHLLKRLFLPHFMRLPLWQILIDHRDWVYFWALYSVPLVHVSVLMQDKTGVFWLQWPCNTVWFRYCDPSYFVLLSQNCCNYLGSFMVPYKFSKYFFCICEIFHWFFKSFFDMKCLELRSENCEYSVE